MRLKGFSLMERKAILISIHPGYVEKIISGEKKLEFRRTWATQPTDVLVIYATYPIQRIVAVANVEQVIVGSRSRMWELSRDVGGGISRSKLFSYLNGKTTAVAIEMAEVTPIDGGVDPKFLFGHSFRPPQSFRYLNDDEYSKLGAVMRE